MNRIPPDFPAPDDSIKWPDGRSVDLIFRRPAMPLTYVDVLGLQRSLNMVNRGEVLGVAPGHLRFSRLNWMAGGTIEITLTLCVDGFDELLYPRGDLQPLAEVLRKHEAAMN